MYNKRQLILFLLAIIILFLSTDFTAIVAQTKQKKKHTNQSKYSNVPFNVSASHLQKQYLGHDLENIYQILERRRPENILKDEFETSQQYHQRLIEELNKPISDSLTLNSIYAFKAAKCFIEYNADNRILIPSCLLSPVFEKSDVSSTKKSIVYSTKDEDKGSYIGTNAFGASRTIYKSEYTNYEITFENYAQFSREIKDGMLYLTSKLNIDPQDAKKIKPLISALIICQLEKPYVSKEQFFEKATFDSPFTRETNYYYLHVRLNEVVFYDLSTGDIFTRSK